MAEITFPSGRTAQEVVPRDAAALAWMANLGCIELHPHPVRADDLDRPDELRVDLDPVPGVEWAQIRQVAQVAREVLADFGLVGDIFELVPQLFDTVRSSGFEYSTPVNAYADLPRLMAALQAGDPDRLYLVSLGPAGTLVTAWLSRIGRWAIDIGHISDSWANVFNSGEWPESLDVRRK